MSVVDDIKLDSRIVGGLQSVITAKDVLNSRAADRLSLVGVAGYAADNITYFSDLDNKPVRECVEVHPGKVYPFYCAPVDALDRVLPYQFFIRESQVLIFREQEEPKARPFTIAEFNERFKLGSSVHFVEKDGGYERRVMYIGYCIDKSEVWVSLGHNSYKLDELFNRFKLAIGYVKKDGREEPMWGVFGVDSGVMPYEGSLQR